MTFRLHVKAELKSARTNHVYVTGLDVDFLSYTNPSGTRTSFARGNQCSKCHEPLGHIHQPDCSLATKIAKTTE